MNDTVKLIKDLYEELQEILGSPYCQTEADDEVMERAREYLSKKGLV